jgi:hypothetical protein
VDRISIPFVPKHQSTPSHSTELEMGIAGWGYSRLSHSEINALRRRLPRWAVEGTSGHFFKYADEQTILAVQALDHAIERYGIDVRKQANFAVIAAPRFVGRAASAVTFQRFLRDGASGVSPHIIPQHSLHSVSGAISVLLGCHGPNVGVGGGPKALDDAFLAAATLFERDAGAGVWLTCTAWDPEPVVDREGNCTNEPQCHAFALAVGSCNMQSRQGTIRLRFPSAAASTHNQSTDKSEAHLGVSEIRVADIVSEMMRTDTRQMPGSLRWHMTWGATVELGLTTQAAYRSLAA